MYRNTGLALLAVMLTGTFLWVVSGSFPEGTATENMSAPNVHVELDKENGKAAVFIRGKHFTTYRFHEDHRIPFLWPVYSGDGSTVTRNWPMGEDDPESNDHPHHQSIWTAFGDVNGFDHWHNEPVITNEIEVASGELRGSIRAQNIWVDDRGNPVVDEIREYTFFDTPSSARFFDQTVTFKASYGDVTFGDDKEGLFAFRIRTDIQGNRAGMLTNAFGETGERAVYGTPVPWMDYSGKVEGVGVLGITLFSHPDNFRLPAWHVRDYGLVGCNFFAMKDVAGLDDEGTYLLEKGNELTLRVRYLIYSGHKDTAELQEHYEQFSRD